MRPLLDRLYVISFICKAARARGGGAVYLFFGALGQDKWFVYSKYISPFLLLYINLTTMWIITLSTGKPTLYGFFSLITAARAISCKFLFSKMENDQPLNLGTHKDLLIYIYLITEIQKVFQVEVSEVIVMIRGAGGKDKSSSYATVYM